MDRSTYFLSGPIPPDAMGGSYDTGLVILSYLMAVLASYVALDITERLRTTDDESSSKRSWLIGGAVTMGLGIWTMHFIGMLAFVMPMPMDYDPLMTAVSLVVAIIASAFAFFLIKNPEFRLFPLIGGGILMGFGISAMHYIGMSAMMHVRIYYLPGLFTLSILIAAADGIIVTDHFGIIEECNRAAAEIFGYLVQDITSHSIENFVGIAKRTLDPPFQPVIFSSLASTEEPLEYIGLRRDSTLIPIEMNISRSQVSGKVLYIIVLRDISERKRAQENLTMLNQQIVAAARVAGMAEVAMCMLHNVGNVLNSVNVSAQVLLDRNSESQIPALIALANLLEKHKDNLPTFLKTDPVGKILPEYLQRFAEFWKSEQDFQNRELEALNSKVQHIKNIVAMQQSLSGRKNIIEIAPINDLLEDALAINSESIERHHIIIERQYETMDPIELDKVNTLQTLVNLIKNAIESAIASENTPKRLILSTKSLEEDFICVEVTDNGLGIEQTDLNRIFNYGFTTKKSGHGFGLHASALSAQEIGGSLKGFSPGPNQGATFALTLPKHIHKDNLTEAHL